MLRSSRPAPQFERLRVLLGIETSDGLARVSDERMRLSLAPEVQHESDSACSDLRGTHRSRRVRWRVFGSVEFLKDSHFEGVVLCKTDINLRTGVSVNGRLLAQTAVSLDQNDVSEPAP